MFGTTPGLAPKMAFGSFNFRSFFLGKAGSTDSTITGSWVGASEGASGCAESAIEGTMKIDDKLLSGSAVASPL